MIDQLSPDVVEEAAAVVEEAAAVVKVADAEVAKLRSVSADLDERSLAAAQATELASSNHRRGLGQRELGESISDTTLAKLKSDRADAVFVEEGLAEARKEIADRLSRAEADLLAATETLLLARIRMVCTLAQGFINDTLYHDALAGAHVDSLKALAVEANRDRAALQNLCGVRLLLPDFCTLATSKMPWNFHGNQLESAVDRAVLSWRGMYSLPHQGPESSRLDISQDFPVTYPTLPDPPAA